MSEAELRARVEDTLRKATALESLWGQPITASQLQAELERMAQASRAPATQPRLFAALNHDAKLIAETLARQALADRQVRSPYEGDERFQAEVLERAQRALEASMLVEDWLAQGTIFRRQVWERATEAEPALAPEALESDCDGDGIGPFGGDCADDDAGSTAPGPVLGLGFTSASDLEWTGAALVVSYDVVKGTWGRCASAAATSRARCSTASTTTRRARRHPTPRSRRRVRASITSCAPSRPRARLHRARERVSSSLRWTSISRSDSRRP
jgi:hypothetical protein